MIMPGIELAATNPLQVTFVGVIIAIVFLTSIVGVLGWMLRLPKETDSMREAAKAVRAVNKMTRILVPLVRENEATDRVVALATQMAHHRNGSIEVLAVIDVPFTLPLNASVEEDEKRAREELNHAEMVASRCGNRNGCAIHKHILKGRNTGVAIVREAEEQAVDLILMANSPVRVRGNLQQIDPAIEYVMKNAPCEVLVLSQGQTSTLLNGFGDAQSNGHTDGTGKIAAHSH